MSRHWPDMFFGKVVGGTTGNRPVPAKPKSAYAASSYASGPATALAEPPPALSPLSGMTTRIPLPVATPPPQALFATAPPTAPAPRGSTQWPTMFFGRPQTTSRPASAPTSVTARIPLSALPPGAVPPYLNSSGQVPATTTPPPKPATAPTRSTLGTQWPAMFFGTPVTLPAPPAATKPAPKSTAPATAPSFTLRKEPAASHWPDLFFGGRTTVIVHAPAPEAPPLTPVNAPVTRLVPPPTTAFTPAPTPAVTRPPVAPAAPAPSPFPAPTLTPAPGENPLAAFLTPLGQRPTGISKIVLPSRHAPAASTPPPAAPQVPATPAPIAKTPEPVSIPVLPITTPVAPAVVPAAPTPIPAPAPALVSPATTTLPPQPTSVPTPIAPPVSPVPAAPLPSSEPATVVLPPAFSREAAPVEVPVAVLRPEPTTATSTPVAGTELQREFMLNNGERISGRVVSETAETVYLHNDALGVLTISKGQLAQKLREVILLNGDRIVGDVIAENAEFIYIRNASLGTLTIPKAHSSQKVIEVILRNGDRVVGELITETDELVLIKSATLGTVSVGRKAIEMVNRRLEHHPIKPLAN